MATRFDRFYRDRLAGVVAPENGTKFSGPRPEFQTPEIASRDGPDIKVGIIGIGFQFIQLYSHLIADIGRLTKHGL
ncbi:MAG: hypothetical protein QF511_04860 [Rhodospirillales bacterium]|nr:hypothetical protein [Rhodospirillales bacterium]HIJ43513.1 hypothetical protein [Rhodospirillaceae bacterium]MDP7097834.1 hypothetical protein [Rhodospirillales bacterium]MDP7215458.1 hypothetical protein [Rhodospirillales bacterium]HIJ45262.1 hypothetical protein [Rhodospirillaceae bacterium]